MKSLYVDPYLRHVAKTRPVNLLVSQILPTRPHAYTIYITVKDTSNGTVYEKREVCISDSIVDPVEVTYRIRKMFESDGFIVNRVSRLTRQMLRFNKKIATVW